MAVYLNGAASYTGLTTATAVTETDQLLLHLWFDGTSPGAIGYIITSNSSAIFYIRQQSNGKLFVRHEDTATALCFALESTTNFTALSGWVAVDVVVDCTQGFAKMYINGVVEATDTPAGANIEHESAAWTVGSRNGSADFYIGQLDQLGYWTSFTSDYVSATGELTGEYFRRMYDTDEDGVLYRKNVSIASALAVQPIILLENDYSTFSTNNGSVGTFSNTQGTPAPVVTGREVPVGQWSFQG